MKYILLSSLILVSFQYTNAQTKKSDILLGGNASFDFSQSKYDTRETKTFSITGSPRVGLFLFDNFCFGTSFAFSVVKTKNLSGYSGNYDRNTTSFGMGPFVRYYIPVEKFLIITEVAYLLNEVDSEFTNNYADNETTTKTFQLASGLGIFVSKNIVLEIMATYQHTDSDYSERYLYSANDFKTNRIFVSAGLQFHFLKAE